MHRAAQDRPRGRESGSGGACKRHRAERPDERIRALHGPCRRPLSPARSNRGSPRRSAAENTALSTRSFCACRSCSCQRYLSISHRRSRDGPGRTAQAAHRANRAAQSVCSSQARCCSLPHEAGQSHLRACGPGRLPRSLRDDDTLGCFEQHCDMSLPSRSSSWIIAARPENLEIAKSSEMRPDPDSLALRDVFEPSEGAMLRRETASDLFARCSWEISDRGSITLDRFRDANGASCGFVRLSPSEAHTIRFVVESAYGLEACPSGGWLLKPGEAALPTYWIPQPPVSRAMDAQGRILSEEPTTLSAFEPTTSGTTIELAMRNTSPLECAIWRLGAEASAIVGDLERPL